MSRSFSFLARRVVRRAALCSVTVALMGSSFVCAGASAQSVLVGGDVLIANVDGLFHLRDGDARLLDTSTSLGLSLTMKPTIEWDRGTDAVFIASDERLLRVSVLSLVPAQLFVEDITPTVTTPGGGSPRFVDIDSNPGNGELFLLESKSDRVLTFTPPFTPGMVASSDIDVVAGSRAMAYDSRRFPNGFAIATSQTVDVYRVGGGIEAVSDGSYNGLDVDHQIPLGVFQSLANENRVQLSTFNATSFAFDLNALGSCQGIARRPTDIEWNAGDHYLYVLAQDGVSQACFPGYVGDNHVVRLPHVQGGGFVPNVITSFGQSGITGVKGDLTVVQQPVAFAVPYGTSTGPRLDGIGGFKGPGLGNDDFRLTIEGGDPFVFSALIVGLDRDNVPFLGATLWASFDSVFVLPSLDDQGELELIKPVPNDATLIGLNVYLQSLHGGPGSWEVSHGLQLHLR